MASGQLLESREQNLTQSEVHHFIAEVLEKAQIRINGSHPWDMRLRDKRVLDEALARGNLGLGESYMDGQWHVEHLDEFFCRLLRTRLTDHVRPWKLFIHAFAARYLNRQTKRRAWQVGEAHYDLGNDFYAAMLDPRMTYTCGYWENASNLAEAQEAKLDLICRKLQLQPGMRVLDIGCGWGSFMGYAAQHYGVECVGISISKEQVEWAQEKYKDLPLDFRLQDYRQLNEKFDRIASVGMFEHVGRRNYRSFMEVAHRCLHEDGLFLLHTIGKNMRHSAPDPWIDRYIFPNGDLPSIGQIGDAVDELFVVEDLHNFGAAWPQFADKLGDRFYRMWTYYLLSCAGAFRARDIQLWQWVLSKKGLIGGYHRERI